MGKRGADSDTLGDALVDEQASEIVAAEPEDAQDQLQRVVKGSAATKPAVSAD